MLEVDAEGCAVCEGHEDPDVFRLRFGKAINFEYSEDSYNGLFQRRDPKEAGPMLDIERAMSKLEKVAIRYRKRTGRPLVLVFNNMHFLKDDEAGQGILHLIQQRAESWAASQCANIVINSDDFRIYDLLSERNPGLAGAKTDYFAAEKNANRMIVLSVRDLDEQTGTTMIRQARKKLYGENMALAEAKEMYDLIGGRMSVTTALAKHKDMRKAALDRIAQEKQWLLSKIGLIPDHDDGRLELARSPFHTLILQCRCDGRAKVVKLLVAIAARAYDLSIDRADMQLMCPSTVVKQAETSDDPKVTWFRAREVMSVFLDRVSRQRLTVMSGRGQISWATSII